MNKGPNYTIIIAVVLALALIVFGILYFSNGSADYNWSENYNVSQNDPYSTSVIEKVLGDYFPDKKETIVRSDLSTALSDTITDHRNYIFIGGALFLGDTDLYMLKAFVRNGNDAFIATNVFPKNLSDALFGPLLNYIGEASISSLTDDSSGTNQKHHEHYDFDSVFYKHDLGPAVKLNFYDPAFAASNDYAYTCVVAGDTTTYPWAYFHPLLINAAVEVKALGKINDDNCNYFSVPYGNGKFYFYSDPLVFTNFYEIQEKNLDYTSKVFSYLQPGDIIWDESSKIPDISYKGLFNEPEQAGPLQFILSQSSLRWAWYILIAGILLFAFFKSKRLQQTIPVMEPNENKSLEFAQTIGRMYFLAHDNKQLAAQKMKLFFHFVKDKYGVSNNEEESIFVNKLSLKSEIGSAEIQAILNAWKKSENAHKLSDKELNHFHNLIADFYKNCK